MPELGVYLVNPASRDAMAAALMWSGVSKSGSPAPKPQTSMPSAFIALALASIDKVREGVSFAARSEISMSIWFNRTLFASIKIFNQRFEVVFIYSNDGHFALCIFH